MGKLRSLIEKVRQYSVYLQMEESALDDVRVTLCVHTSCELHVHVHVCACIYSTCVRIINLAYFSSGSRGISRPVNK